MAPVVLPVVEPDDESLELESLELELLLELLDSDPLDDPVDPEELELEESVASVVPVPVLLELAVPDVSVLDMSLELVVVPVPVPLELESDDVPGSSVVVEVAPDDDDVELPEDVDARQSPMHSIDAMPQPGKASASRPMTRRLMDRS